MGVKTVTVRDEAYNVLKARKRGNESFSDAILRLAGSRSLEEFYGALSEKSGRELERAINETRQKRNTLHRQRKKNVLAELM